MNNAIVTLPLSEVDTVRRDLEASKARVKELKATEKKIKVDIREQVADYHHQPISGMGQKIVKGLDWKQHPHTYINLDEVIKPIRDEEEAKVAENTRRLERNIKELTDKFEKTKTGFKDEIKHLNEKHLETLSILKGEKQDDKDRTIKSLQSQIEMLHCELDEMDNMGFWKRVFWRNR